MYDRQTSCLLFSRQKEDYGRKKNDKRNDRFSRIYIVIDRNVCTVRICVRSPYVMDGMSKEEKNLDIALFRALYDLKSLSLRQCRQVMHIGERAEEHLLELVHEGFLSYTFEAYCGYRFSLTMKGIDSLRESYGLPRYEIVDGKKRRTFKICKELRIPEGQASHQIAINQFVLDFHDRFMDTEGIHIEAIETERTVFDYDYFRPDGTIVIRNKKGQRMHLFLEQDMGTESRAQLSEKWARYRKFIMTNRGDRHIGRAVMLFIVDYDTTKAPPHGLTFNCMDKVYEFREKEVFRTIRELFSDLYDGFFDIYIGTEAELMAALEKRIVPEFLGQERFLKDIVVPFAKRRGLDIYRAGFLKKDFDGTAYTYLLRGHDKTYVLDDPSFIPLSVIARAEMVNSSNVFFQERHPDIPVPVYLILSDDMTRLDEFLEFAGIEELPGTERIAIKRKSRSR